MVNLGDIVELKIEKMIYEGVGLSHLEDGLTVFVENVCDGDFVRAKIIKVKKSYANALLEEIIKPSEFRVKPFCPLHNVCGGCQWQYIEYSHQLKIKQNIVKEILTKTLGKEVDVFETMPSTNIKEFRHKIQMPVKQTKNSKRFLIGYYEKGSHNIVNIKYCPIQPKIVDEIIEKIRTVANDFGVTAYDEKNNVGELRHIVFRVAENSVFENGDILICFVVNNDTISKSISDLSQFIFDEFPQIKGISVNFNTQKNNVILGKKTKLLKGNETYIEKIDDISYFISPESFFQVNPMSFKNILDKVKELIKERTKDYSPTILDAYSGVGSFGLYLSDIASKITCVEEVESACKNAKNACERNNINNVEVFCGDAQKIFENQISDGIKYDVVILDPPRKGCSQEALDYCINFAEKFIVYVSCNPNSLARDLKYLEEKGFELAFVQTADMFCHTYHVETVTVVEKKQSLG